MELRQLTTFVRVAQFQSFSKAAASLGYSQSAVTVQIRLLEEELQVRLFDRMGKRVSLTGKGWVFLDSALNIMQDINNARLSLSGTDEVLRGQLHIGTLESLCYAKLPGIMRKFRIEHPQVCVQITTGTPEELIAQTPLERRDTSRLMTLDRRTGATSHRRFYDLPKLLRPGDCLVMNDSRVLPARLLGHREPGGGACEVLLLRDRGNKTWECLVRPGKKMKAGAHLNFGDGELTAEVTEELPGGNRLVQFHYEGIFLEVPERLGKMPLPPYIKAELQDP